MGKGCGGPSASLLALRRARAVPAAGPGSRRGVTMQKGPAASLDAPLAPGAAALLALGSRSGMTVWLQLGRGVTWRGAMLMQPTVPVTTEKQMLTPALLKKAEAKSQIRNRFAS